MFNNNNLIDLVINNYIATLIIRQDLTKNIIYKCQNLKYSKEYINFNV